LLPSGRRARRTIQRLGVVGAFFVSAACTESGPAVEADLDRELLPALAAANVTPVSLPPRDPVALVELGRLLFFDKVLSGNKNIACATCHHLAYHSTDQLSLGIGTGGVRNGPARKLGGGRFLPRNTADLYNRGLFPVSSLFHDGRVEVDQGNLRTPAGSDFPPGLSSLLAAQAMFPVTGRDEMRGLEGDTTRFGESNELAALADGDFAGIWSALIDRVLSYPEYLSRFQSVFPGIDSGEIGFHHAALAIAAFERAVFTQLDSPFDHYLAGNRAALSDSAKRGAILFYGRARCATCHGGALQSDEAFHNIGVPQLGAGVGIAAPLDVGRAAVTGRVQDRFAFRTPSLRNVTLTGPWMHNGAYTNLENAIRHYRDPRLAYRDYDLAQLDPRVAPLIQLDPSIQAQVMATLDSGVAQPLRLSPTDVALLHAFLRSLTDPAAFIQLEEIPDSVPSGLPTFE
jgi:cytochrome c peroxidase